MSLQPELQHTLSAFDVVVMSLPVLAALATAVLSLWRESNKSRHTSLSGESTKSTGTRKRIEASGWTLIALAVATCVTGLYSGVKDLRDAVTRSQENAALQTELQDTRADLGKQLAQSRKETIAAKNATIAATKASADKLKEVADAHAAELKKQQDLTFVSLLSSVNEPAYAIVELDLQHAIPPNWKIGTRSNVAQLMAQTNDDNWRYSLMFEPIFRFIKWTDPMPMNFDTWLGDWPMHDGTDDTRRWGAGVAVMDRTKPKPNIGLRGSIEVRQDRHLIIRFPRLDGQSMIDLWRGPDKQSPRLFIWVQLNDVDDEVTRHIIETLAKKAIIKTTAYYTVSAKATLCKRAALDLYEVHAASNQLRIQYIGTNEFDNVSCPAYVISPQDLY